VGRKFYDFPNRTTKRIVTSKKTKIKRGKQRREGATKRQGIAALVAKKRGQSPKNADGEEERREIRDEEQTRHVAMRPGSERKRPRRRTKSAGRSHLRSGVKALIVGGKLLQWKNHRKRTRTEVKRRTWVRHELSPAQQRREKQTCGI